MNHDTSDSWPSGQPYCNGINGCTCSDPPRQAITLIEILVVVTIIAVLAGLLMPAIAMVKNAAARSQTMSVITSLQASLAVYALEDPRHRHPQTYPDRSLTSGLLDGSGQKNLDILRTFGFEWRAKQLDQQSRLCDGWRRPFMYAVDDNMDKIVDRPAPVNDWNVRGEEPYPYVWSMGRPTAAVQDDALPINAERWLYVRSAP